MNNVEKIVRAYSKTVKAKQIQKERFRLAVKVFLKFIFIVCCLIGLIWLPFLIA